MRLEADLVEPEPEEVSPIQCHVKLDTQTAKKFNALLRPKPDEVAAMLKKFIERKRWSQEMVAAFLNITAARVSDILEGKVCDGAITRLIWLLDRIDDEPEFVKIPLYLFTWGKSKGLVARRDRVPAPPPKPKFKMPRILLPNSPWMYVDYSRSKKDIAALLNVTEERVGENLRTMRGVPKSILLKAFAAVGRMRQANIILRGTCHSRINLNDVLEQTTMDAS